MEVKKSKVIIIIGSLVLLILLGIATYLLITKNGDDEKRDAKKPPLENKTTFTDLTEDLIMKEDDTPLPSWITDNPNLPDNGPWYEGLSMSTSEDGLEFENEKHFLDHAGVPHLLLTSDDILVATFQYFSFENEELFDKIAYATSLDFGETWSEIRLINFTNLHPGPKPVDPTLMELDDGSFRLYFTSQENGEKYPQMYSAKGETLDGEFVNEGKQLDTDEIILDPAIIKYDGMWHHYTVGHGDSFDFEQSSQSVSVHSISEDGLNFERVDDISLDMQFLGDVIEVDGGIRFYNGSQSAFSTDGYEWAIESGERVKGADPGVVRLPDGSYLAVYTTM